jgi:hypothetical protein
MTSKRHLIEGDVLRVCRNGDDVGVRRGLNLVEGANVTLSLTDNAADDRVEVVVSAAAGGSAELTEAAIEAALTNVSFGDGVVEIGGVGVLGARQPAVAVLSPTANLTDARNAVNAIIAVLNAHGLTG